MALLFIEGFDIYGASESELTDGVYLEANQSELSSAQARTGTYSVRSMGAGMRLRRALYGEYLALGIAHAFFLTEMPNQTAVVQLAAFRNDQNTVQMAVFVTAAGNIVVTRGDEFGTTLAQTTTSPIITDAWQHFEMQVSFSDTVGWFEIRLDGVTVLQATNLDNIASTVLKNCNQVEGVGTTDVWVTPNAIIYMDDFYCYDFSGTENNDWIGDRRVLTLWPSDNGVDQDWTANGASSQHACINQNPADGDTSYIEVSDAVLPANSNFELDDVPGYVGAIAGVQVYVKSKKTEAGECNLQVSMQSGISESNGTNRPVSTIYAHRTDMFELDPATGALWTPSGLSAALVDIERTA